RGEDMTEAGHDADDRTARRARRNRWRSDGADATGAERARTEQADAWLDAWLGLPAGPTADPLDVLDAIRATGGDLPRTSDALRAVEPLGWTVLHDLHRPGRARATVEHVAVGPGGIVVVETLRWDGEVRVVEGTLRHRGYGRTPDVATVADTASAVTALLAPTHRRAVHAVLCLAGQSLDPVSVRGGAVAVGLAELPAYLVSLPGLLAPADVPLVVDYLAAELAGATGPEQLTVDDVFRPAVVWDAPDVPQQHHDQARPATREPWPADRLGEWPAPPEDEPTARPSGAGDRSAPDLRTPQGADAYLPPANGPVAGGPTGPTDLARDPAAPARRRGPLGRVPGRRRPTPTGAAVGDSVLRSILVALGLLTAGNLVLAWLSATG
ncbi:MAG TPA: NERD domain-containing protein, partial [Cellulomonas sp.]